MNMDFLWIIWRKQEIKRETDALWLVVISLVKLFVKHFLKWWHYFCIENFEMFQHGSMEKLNEHLEFGISLFTAAI